MQILICVSAGFYALGLSVSQQSTQLLDHFRLVPFQDLVTLGAFESSGHSSVVGLPLIIVMYYVQMDEDGDGVSRIADDSN